MNDQSDFRRLLRIAKRRWAWLVFIPLGCSAAAFAVESSESNVYQAAADIRIDGDDIATDVALITSQEVNAAARDRIGDEAVNVLSVDASTIGDTQLARITVRATTPEVAALAANEWARAFADVRNEGQTADLVTELNGLLEAADLLLPELLDVEDRISQLEAVVEPSADERSELGDLRSRQSLLQSQQRDLVDRATAIQTQLITTPVIVTTTNQASEPNRPADPKPLRQALFGLFGGLFLGILAAGLAELLDDRIWEPSDLARATGGLRGAGQHPSLGSTREVGSGSRHVRQTPAPRVRSIRHAGPDAAPWGIARGLSDDRDDVVVAQRWHLAGRKQSCRGICSARRTRGHGRVHLRRAGPIGSVRCGSERRHR